MVALVVLNYNDYETTSQFVTSIRDYESIGKIIVVDNCSTDDSYIQLCTLQSEKVDVLRTEANRGYASGNNFGVRYALQQYGPEYIIISNPDVEFKAEIIDILREKAEQKENMGVITCIMNCISGIQLESAWKKPRYRDYLISSMPLTNRLIGSIMTYSQAELAGEVVEVDAVPGSFFMISARAFVDVDGMDERTFLYCEESILAARLHQKGYRNYLVTTAEYIHKHSVSINKSISSVKRRLQIRQQSREIYCEKYLGIGKGKMLLFRLVFTVGLYEYLLITKVRMLLKQFR